jgi:hypothetical protein
VIGFTDLHAANGQHLSAADVTCILIGCAGSALIGLGFGAITRLESRGGYLWAQLPVYGLWLWGAMAAWRAVLIVVAAAMHAHVASSSSTLLFGLGVNRLAQAAVIVPRALSMGVPFAPERDGSTLLAGLIDRGGDGGGFGRASSQDAYAAREAYRSGGYDRGGRDEDYERGDYDGGYDRDAHDGPVDLGREFGRESGREPGRAEDYGLIRDRRDRRHGLLGDRRQGLLHDRRHDRRRGRFDDH